MIPNNIKIYSMAIFERAIVFISLVALFIGIYGCDKSDLEAKPQQSMVIPSKLEDYQNLLNNSTIAGSTPNIGEMGSDNYYLLPERWNSLPAINKNAYVWELDVFEGNSVNDWNYPYVNWVFTANVVLDGLKDINPENDREQYNFIRGEALFIRAHAFWQLAQVFCKPYNHATSTEDLGLPLPIKPDVLAKVDRSTLEETYQLILKDLMEAANLVNIEETPYKILPTKATVLGMISRVYLSMRDYDSALQYAEESLSIYNKLMDYNDLDASASSPIARDNVEILYASRFIGSSIFNSQSNCPVDTLLYESYADNDLRKVIFFREINGLMCYKGSYAQSSISKFGGIATDEVYLTKAECLARQNKTDQAMDALNDLLVTRWKTGTFVPLSATTPEEALDIILDERRKELIFRGLRWMDLRRLNLEGANIILTRNLDGEIYTLSPNSSRYVYPIPQDELNINPMLQNERE